jgi:hypothetical protein
MAVRKLVPDAPHLFFEHGEVSLRQNPHLLEIQPELLVHKDVPERNDGRPRYFAIAVLNWLRNAAGCLTDHLQVMDDPNLQQFAGQELFEAVWPARSDFGDRFQDVVHPVRIAPHTATASR